MRFVLGIALINYFFVPLHFLFRSLGELVVFLNQRKMKKILILLLCALFVLPLSAQDKKDKKERRKNRRHEVVHDTVYIFVDKFEEADSGDENDTVDVSLQPTVLDTLSTDNKFVKVVIFDDNTWTYFELPRPELPDSITSDHWADNSIHAYGDIDEKSLPNEIEIVLCDSTHGYCIPVPGIVTSRYRFRGTRPHKGIDLDLHTGDDVKAAFDGVVRVSLPTNKAGGYGNIIVIRHANGLETYYAHLSKRLVESGDTVQAGEVIALGGSTGRSTGSHLHFETRYMGQTLDPERIFDFEKGTLKDSTLTVKKQYFNNYSHSSKGGKGSASTSGKKVHVVKQGDTLGAIARKYGTSIDTLCRINGIKRNSILRLGQKIVVK